ncbi:bifunctional riboflavin kinase/FAD synthetase [Desulfovibrio legallii]|uniref:bifunctional riboflavin kinase/FAD synthetase n=1 Tax=Desulfovibrio legallii TaxID=571438 RepID=UPI000E48ED89|nr:bifunctional riboflavin kinase/FAD synthetase [Desulfovibrio legallii]RHH24807.1 bifunctional riboflavin kinase/FAD synthetase [Desulfovibrio sp. AM18-2]
MNIAHTVASLGAPAGTGVTIGNFDGLHLGHQALIRRTLEVCRQDGLTPVVLTFWPHPRLVLFPDQGHMPLCTRQDRLDRLTQLGVPQVLELPFDRDLAALDAAAFVRRYLLPMNLRRLVVGYDFSLGRNRGGHVDVLRNLGAEAGFSVEQLAPVVVDGTVVSSTALRRLIGRGDVREAAVLLGRCHGFSGPVVHGDGRGKGLGFPTANLQYPQVVLPARGVYATRVTLEGRVWPSVTNVGHKPTFGRNELTVEAFLLENCPDLYGRTLRLDFVDRLRDERRFADAEELKAQINTDVAAARRTLATAARG